MEVWPSFYSNFLQPRLYNIFIDGMHLAQFYVRINQVNEYSMQ